jgi:hypothetical protein
MPRIARRNPRFRIRVQESYASPHRAATNLPAQPQQLAAAKSQARRPFLRSNEPSFLPRNRFLTDGSLKKVRIPAPLTPLPASRWSALLAVLPQLLINAFTGQVRSGANMSGYPTNQELARRSRRLLAVVCCNAPR